jgi:Holliday junction resolvase
MKTPPGEPHDVLNRIQRGLSGYVSYLAACEMNQSFSEYVLYEPMLRILTARGYSVKCEYPCPGFPTNGAGDKKKIDFWAEGEKCSLAIEVKWAKFFRIDLRNDFVKLLKFRENVPGSRCCLCVFGRQSVLERIRLPKVAFREILNARYAELGKTRYGCRVFELEKGAREASL